MNSLKNKPTAVLTVLALGLGALAIVLRVFSLLFFYDAEIGYYQSGAILPVISNITFALSAIALAILPFLLIDRAKTVPAPGGKLKYAALIPAAAFFAIAALSAADAMGNLGVYELLMLLSAVSAVTFFASLALIKQPSGITVGCGIGFILWLALTWLSSYTDFTVTMNSPDKLFFHFACVGAALLAIAELRAAYGMASARAYCCYISLSVLTLSAGAVTPVMGSLCGIYKHNPTVSESAVFCALLVYATVRLISVSRADRIPREDEPAESAEQTEPANQEEEKI